MSSETCVSICQRGLHLWTTDFYEEVESGKTVLEIQEIPMAAAREGAAHQLNAIRDVVRRDVDRGVRESEETFGLTGREAAEVAAIGRDERMLDEIRASRIRPEHIRIMQLRFPRFSEPECVRRIVRGMDLFDCEPLDAIECLTTLLMMEDGS